VSYDWLDPGNLNSPNSETTGVKEATKGYFHDLNATRKYGGKTWIAPPRMIRPEVSTICTV
jgi:hypothetical protein